MDCWKQQILSQLCQFPFNEALHKVSWFLVCGQQCIWAGTKTSSERIVQNLEVQKIQTVLDTVQATIVNLRLHDEEIPWCIQRSGLDNRSLEQIFVTWWTHFKAIPIKSAHIQRFGSVPWWKRRRTSSDSTGTRNGSNWIFHWDPGI